MYIIFISVHRLQRYTFICNWQNATENIKNNTTIQNFKTIPYNK